MKRMIVIMVLMSVWLLSACGAQKGETKMTERVETIQSTEKAEITIQTLWDSFGLGMTAWEALNQAKDIPEIAFVYKDEWIHEDRLKAFYENTRRGEKDALLTLFYYDEVGVRMGVELFRENEGEYPVAYLMRLVFDGELYHFTVRRTDSMEIEEGDEGSYPCLMHYEGSTKSPATPLLYDRYVLTLDDTHSWEDLEWSMLSSDSRDFISFRSVAGRLYKDPAAWPAESYIPGKEEMSFWWRIDGKETRNTHFALADIGSFEGARKHFAPQDKNATYILSYWEGERVLWKRELHIHYEASAPTEKGILLYGHDQVLHYDAQGELLWEYQGIHKPYRELLAVGEEGGQMSILFRTTEGEGYVVGAKAVAEIWILNEAGQLQSSSETALGPGGEKAVVKAACFLENQALLALQGSHPSRQAAFYWATPNTQEIVPTLELPGGLAPMEDFLMIQDILIRDGWLYISAYLCREYGFNEYYRYVPKRDEVQDVIEYCYTKAADASDEETYKQIMAELSREITPMVQERYTAVLYRTPLMMSGRVHEPGDFQLLQSRAGSLGSRLYRNEYGEIAWEIDEIRDVVYEPATSAFNLYAPCRVLQFFYDPGEEEGDALIGVEPGGYMIMDKMVTFSR